MIIDTTAMLKTGRPQFSLRAVLVAVSIVSIVLGLGLYLARPRPTMPPLDHGDFGSTRVLMH